MTVTTAPFLSWGWWTGFATPTNLKQRLVDMREHDTLATRRNYLIAEKANLISAKKYAKGMLEVHSKLAEGDVAYKNAEVALFLHTMIRHYQKLLTQVNAELRVVNHRLGE